MQALLVSVPDAQLAKTIAELAGAEIDWNGKSVVLCDTWIQSGELEALTKRGASAGSLNPVEGFARLFVVEGAGPAVRAVRRLVETQGSRVVEIRGGAKHLYSASLVLSGDLLVPTLWAALGTLRETGVSPNEAARMIEGFFLQSLRAFLKGGRKAWAGPLAAHNEAAIEEQIEALEKLNPELARFYRRQARAALELFGVDAEWVGNPER